MLDGLAERSIYALRGSARSVFLHGDVRSQTLYYELLEILNRYQQGERQPCEAPMLVKLWKSLSIVSSYDTNSSQSFALQGPYILIDTAKNISIVHRANAKNCRDFPILQPC